MSGIEASQSMLALELPHPEPSDDIGQPVDVGDLSMRAIRIAQLLKIAPDNISNIEQKNQITDTIAEFCRDAGLVHGCDGGDITTHVNVAQTGARWLEASLDYYLYQKLLRTYQPNERLAEDDILQIAREHLIFEAIPTYDASKSSFSSWYQSTVWRRVQDVYSRNISHFGTPQHNPIKRSDASAESKQAMEAASKTGSYSSDLETMGLEGGDVLDGAVSLTLEHNPFTTPESILDHDEFIWQSNRIRELIYTPGLLSELQRCAVIAVKLEGLTYQEAADRYGYSAKSIDNALVKAMTNLRTAAL